MIRDLIRGWDQTVLDLTGWTDSYMKFLKETYDIRNILRDHYIDKTYNLKRGF